MGFFRKKAKSLVRRALNSSSSSEPAPTNEPEDSGTQFAQMECGAQELKERLDAGEDVVVVDVRESRELQSGLLPGALHIPMREMGARWKELADANEIVCYCQSGARSYETAMMLRSKGLFNATSLEGGIAAWRAIGGDTPSA